MNYVIEKNVPVPSNYKRTGLSGTAREMNVGDSIFLAGKTTTAVLQGVRHLRPMKFTARAVEGGARMWRIA